MNPYESSTEATQLLQWNTLDIRPKFHHFAIIYKSRKNEISYTFNTKIGKKLHKIETRSNEQYYLPKAKINWKRKVSFHLFIDN